MKNIRRLFSALCLLAGSGAAEQGGQFLIVVVCGGLALLLAAPDMRRSAGHETAYISTSKTDGGKCA